MKSEKERLSKNEKLDIIMGSIVIGLVIITATLSIGTLVLAFKGMGLWEATKMQRSTPSCTGGGIGSLIVVFLLVIILAISNILELLGLWT